MNHGPFAWGTEADNAVHNAVVMEEIAKLPIVPLRLPPAFQQLIRAY